MEDPLIDNEPETSTHVIPQITTLLSRIFHQRSHAFISGDRFHKAAALVDLAEDDVGLSEEVLTMANFERAVRFYFIDMRLKLVWSLNLTALVLLNFFEMPLWCDGSSSEPCGNRETFYLGALPYLTRRQSLYYEVVTWVILVVHILFPITYLTSNNFWKSRVDLLKVCLVIILGADILVYAIYLIPSGPIQDLPFRLTPYLRVVILIIDVRALRECAKTGIVIIRVLDVVVLFVLFLLFASGLAFVLFEDTQQGTIYFSSYGNTLYEMFVLFTTSNNPDVWLPAYKASRHTCLFFILYILFGVYFITNLILAVVYDSFKEQLAKIIVERRSKRKNVLGAAFNLLDVRGRGYLDIEECLSLLKALNKYRTLLKIEEENFEAMFYALDNSGDFKINKEEFNELCDDISLKFPKIAKPSWFERFPSCYESSFSKKLKHFVKSETFEYVVVGMLLLNLVAVIIETTLDLENNSGHQIWQDVEFVFGWLYVIEMLLKIYACGFDAYWQDGQNKFDFIITWIIVVAETLTFVLPNSFPVISNEEWIRYLLIARLLRLIRLLMQVNRYRVIISTFLKLIPRLAPYLGIIFCLMCLYCSLGVQLFGGLVNEDNTSLEDTGLYENDYLVHNFNDYPTGMVTLFELLVMGSWQVWLESFVTLTGSWWTSIYFISFYAIAVLFLLNLVVAFVLEAFFAEMELSASSINIPVSELGRQEEFIQRIRQARSENVDALLNHMLSPELEKEE